MKIQPLAAGTFPLQGVSATEGGGTNYLPGFYGDFGMAIMPDKGFHFDYTVAHYLRSDIGLRVTGSYYQQVTSDSAPLGVEVSPMGEAATIGPAILYAPRIGERDVTMSLKWLHEFNVKGRQPFD